ncbi:hypothetical protein PLIIFM63780_008489 [Purpureocillium lilacinum]|nr:hypothetical protein PLIIFM63780_008489 [Purpureocillium lilacinum]
MRMLGKGLGAWACLALWARRSYAVPPTPAPEPREMVFEHGMGAHDVVYHITIPQFANEPLMHFPTVTPAQVQRQGGIQELDGYALPRLLLTSSNLSEVLEQGAHNPGSWIYELATGPHMIESGAINADPDAEPRHYLAVGGIVWSQIISFAVTDGQDRAEDLEWQVNSAYNNTWERFGASQWQPIFGGDGPGAAEQSERLQRLAADEMDPYGEFLDELTGNYNPALDDAQRQTLRELLDWDRTHFPARTWPLARQNNSPTQLTVTALGTDWGALNVETRLRLTLEGGLPSAIDVVRLLRFLAGPHFSGARYTMALDGVDPRGKYTSLATIPAWLSAKHRTSRGSARHSSCHGIADEQQDSVGPIRAGYLPTRREWNA